MKKIIPATATTYAYVEEDEQASKTGSTLPKIGAIRVKMDPKAIPGVSVELNETDTLSLRYKKKLQPGNILQY